MTLINSNIEATNRRRAPSRTVGSYAVLELLGSGAFGSVYMVVICATLALYASFKLKYVIFAEPFSIWQRPEQL